MAKISGLGRGLENIFSENAIEENNELTKLQKGETDTVIFSEDDEQFQAFGLLVLFLLIIEVCVLESKNPLLKNVSLFKKKRITHEE